jgi:hypothetical protein
MTSTNSSQNRDYDNRNRQINNKYICRNSVSVQINQVLKEKKANATRLSSQDVNA